MAIAPLDGGAIKQSRASLVGGIAVALGVMALWVAILRDLGVDGGLGMLVGGVLSGLVGLWIWRADL